MPAKIKEQPPVVKRTIFSWVLPGNMKLQLTLVVIIVITVGARLLPLEMQKRIVNEAISLRKMDLLYLYCGLYLAAVIVASGLKFAITMLQTYIAEKTLANLRRDLYHHILTLPLSFFRRTQPGMVVSSLVTELTTTGNFVGMAIAVPLVNILTLVAFAAYLLWLNWLLALISLSIYPMVLFLVPFLQKRANRANKKRVNVSFEMSSKIAESITGIHEVHGNGSYHIESGKFNRMVNKIFRIRMVWTLYTQAIKVANNFFTSISPFLIFLLGGYLAMTGKLELGALVAFLSAQEKLYDPWKELIEFYQVYQDSSVRYRKTMKYFDFEPEFKLAPPDRARYELDGRLEVQDLSFVTDDGIRLIEDVNLTLKPGEHLALVGFSGSGKSTLAQCIGQLYKYSSGHVWLGEKEVKDLTKLDVVQNVGFVSQDPFIFDGTIEENMLYACQSIILNDEDARKYPPPTLDNIIEVLQQTGVFVDVLRFGLNAILNQNQHSDLLESLIRIRANFQKTYGEELADYVEFFREDEYLYHSSISENLIFGTPADAAFQDDNLLRNEYFLAFLTEADLTRPLLSMGAGLCRQTVDILGDLTPDRMFFEQSPLKMDELEDFKLLAERLKDAKLHQLGEEDRGMLLTLALRFTPGRHKMVAMPEMLKSLILEGRALFREKAGQERPGAVVAFHKDEYIFSQTILNNILFGKMKTGRAEAQDRIDRSINHLLVEEDMLEKIVKIGMQFQVGSKGDRLSGGQRQKLAIARVFLKAPKVMILDEATSALDNRSQARIQNQLDTRWKGRSTVIAVVHRLDITRNFDKIAVMKAGKIMEMGSYEELMERKGILYDLVAGRK